MTLSAGSTLDVNTNYAVNDVATPYSYKCNSNSNMASSVLGTNQEAYNAFNAIYDVYYQNVIQTNNGGANYKNEINTYCSGGGGGNNYCPGNDAANSNKENISNYFYKSGTNIGANSMKYSDLKPYLEDCARNLQNFQTNETISYTNFSNLDASYNLITQQRNDLDIKMQEILATKGSLVNEHQNYIDGSVYTTLLWTVLATSLIFYTFTKM
jgi:hypothetical protein